MTVFRVQNRSEAVAEGDGRKGRVDEPKRSKSAGPVVGGLCGVRPPKHVSASVVVPLSDLLVVSPLVLLDEAKQQRTGVNGGHARVAAQGPLAG